ncbi:hypothetical protein LCGC14_1962550 [marine sediment metagenome]|uniref:Uncharacterized protein n=1 Tax=marine sediment metagenome TaxID=412755 RepID=A0A0F9FE26_9ZZZZ
MSSFSGAAGGAAGARVLPTLYVPGEQPYVRPGWAGFQTGTAVLIAGEEYFIPIYVSRTTTYDRIAISTQAGAAGLARLGIYNADDDLQPSTRILDAGTVDVSGAAGYKVKTISQELLEGFYFLTAVSDVAPTCYGPDATGMASLPITASGANASVMKQAVLAVLNQEGHVAGGLPDPATTPEHDRDARYAIVSLREVL